MQKDAWAICCLQTLSDWAIQQICLGPGAGGYSWPRDSLNQQTVRVKYTYWIAVGLLSSGLVVPIDIIQGTIHAL